MTIKDETKYYNEMDKLELEQKALRERQTAEDRDRYNTKEKNISKHDYMRIIDAHHKLAPESSDTLSKYIQKIKVHQEIAHDKNWETHVDNEYRTWHTHKMPHCFMCEDTQFISVLVQVLETIDHLYPKIKF